MPRGNGHGPPWWHGRFRGCGYRLTIGREAVLEALEKTGGHLSAEDIFLQVRGEYPGVGLTTVYRTLDVLHELGMVNKFDFGDGRARYELVEGPGAGDHHHHLVCTGCRRIVDYTEFLEQEKELLRETEAGLSEKYDFRITGHMIQFYGLCAECDRKEESEGK